MLFDKNKLGKTYNLQITVIPYSISHVSGFDAVFEIGPNIPGCVTSM